MDPYASHHDRNILCEEVEVLEDKEEDEVEGHARDQDTSFGQRIANDQNAKPVINSGGGCNEEQKAPIPVAIEHIAGNQEQAVLEFWPSSENPVHGIDHAEEHEKSKAIEQQRMKSLSVK
jgi:hypothetical protein